MQVGACVPAGRFATEDFDAMADVADKYSGGEVRITCEENILFPNVSNDDIEAMRAEPLFEKFKIDAGNVMRGLVSCTGSQFCGFALIETKNRCHPPACVLRAVALRLLALHTGAGGLWCICGRPMCCHDAGAARSALPHPPAESMRLCPVGRFTVIILSRVRGHVSERVAAAAGRSRSRSG